MPSCNMFLSMSDSTFQGFEVIKLQEWKYELIRDSINKG